jgi:hypothetical protein
LPLYFDGVDVVGGFPPQAARSARRTTKTEKVAKSFRAWAEPEILSTACIMAGFLPLLSIRAYNILPFIGIFLLAEGARGVIPMADAMKTVPTRVSRYQISPYGYAWIV